MNRFFLMLLLLFFSVSQFAYGLSASENGVKLRTVIGSKCTVTGCRIGAVNLRSGPGTRYQKAGNLYQGYLLEVLTKKGSWYKVRVIDPPEGKTGWIRNNLVTFE